VRESDIHIHREKRGREGGVQRSQARFLDRGTCDLKCRALRRPSSNFDESSNKRKKSTLGCRTIPKLAKDKRRRVLPSGQAATAPPSTAAAPRVWPNGFAIPLFFVPGEVGLGGEGDRERGGRLAQRERERERE
jgi:hypothetical protein